MMLVYEDRLERNVFYERSGWVQVIVGKYFSRNISRSFSHSHSTVALMVSVLAWVCTVRGQSAFAAPVVVINLCRSEMYRDNVPRIVAHQFQLDSYRLETEG